ncbi:MAG: MFS transporter [Chloroflexi bacterium]|nr:MFS transporter [Chloroflexota bacterium]
MSSTQNDSGFGSVLRIPAFREFWVSQLLALTAQNGIHFIQLVLIERLTGRSFHLGLMIAAFSLPPVIFSFLAGVVVDRVPKKWLIVGADFIRGLLAISYVVFLHTLSDDTLLLTIYAVTFLGSSAGAFFTPAVLAKIPLVVGENRLLVANALFNITIAGAQMLGLIALAPILVKLFGLSIAFLFMGVAYLLAGVLVLRLPRDPDRRVRGVTARSGWQHMRREVREGWVFVAQQQRIYMSVLHIALVATLLMIISMLAPGLSARVLGLAPEDSVLVFAPAGVGMVLAMFILGKWGDRISHGWLQTLLIFWVGLSFLALGMLSRDYSTLHIPIFDIYPQRVVTLTALVALVSLNIGFGLYSVNTVAQTVIQSLTPANLRGRVFTVQSMLTYLVGLVPLMVAATLADLVGIPRLMGWLAYACFAVALLTLYSVYHPATNPSRPLS